MQEPAVDVTWRRRQQVRLIVGCTLGLATGFAGLFIGTLTVFIKPISVEFGWSRAQTASAVVMAMLGLAIGSPLQGRLIDRFGPRPVIGISVLALASLIVLLSFFSGGYALFGACTLAIGALAVATGPNGYLSLLPRMFDRRLGLALAVAMVGVGVGAAVLAPLAQVIVAAKGWRFAYRVLALVSMAGGLAAFLMINVRQPAMIRHAVSAAPADGLTFRQALLDRRLILLMVALLLSSAAGLGMTFHTAPMLDDRGFSSAQIASVVSLSGIGLMSGRLVGGALLDVISARMVGAATYLLGAIATALIGLGWSAGFPYAAAGGLLLGFSLGTEGDFMAYVVRRYFGLKSFGGIYGCLFTAYSLGSVAGVILFGMGYDHFNNYRVATIVGSCGFFAAMFVVLALGPYRFGVEPSE